MDKINCPKCNHEFTIPQPLRSLQKDDIISINDGPQWTITDDCVLDPNTGLITHIIPFDDFKYKILKEEQNV